MEYVQVQDIAKQTISYIKTVIQPGINLLEIRKRCEDKMLKLGADSFWYWDIGAFIFAGDETAVSISGNQYTTTDRIITLNDIITVDLSPQNKNIWGDYSRTIILENGVVVEDMSDIINCEWKNGLIMEDTLHKKMKSFVTYETTFEQLYFYINDFIVCNGYKNLDFMGNLGHSIAEDKDNRIYIEKGNRLKLSDISMFTFEPHISIANSKYGYKKENIYYFRDNHLLEL